KMVRLSEFYAEPRALSVKEKMLKRAAEFLTLRSDILLFNTQWQKNIWSKAYGFDQSRAYVVENEYPAKQSTAATSKKVFVAAGRGIKYKNIPLFEKVFAEVKNKYSEIELDTRP